MKVLVTGGAGFIGSHIVNLLLEQGYETVVCDNFSSGDRKHIPAGVKMYAVDLDSPQLEQIFKIESPNYVIHQAAQVKVALSLNDPFTDAASNIMGTIRLLICCRKFAVKKIIYASSCAVYGEVGDCSILESFPIQPLSFYGLSKYTSEAYIRLFHELFDLSYTILRYSNVYGPRQTSSGEGGVISIFSENLLRGESPSIFGTGEQTRDFIYVKDVAAANVTSLHQGENAVFNISRNEKTSINQLFALMNTITNKSQTPNYLPARNGDIQYSRLDNSRALQLMGWKPIFDLQTGLKDTLTYYQKILSN
ncbi:NAD-dependent epimerase/dehydratase family protein [Paenibacillus sediminis]|uniref:UDP-glucose 4-epimerase n=1 Tax=Paenibacillus sediminis TaxID=664909 RepID=A0ABS4H2A8_9BACL|nr:NAD-dependent epimerase/dehydratase family protein [Paenibacillus sediminis]MBP1936250.1 UDP-glucose 4-epimerase [Paenibacillus sediminis]